MRYVAVFCLLAVVAASGARARTDALEVRTSDLKLAAAGERYVLELRLPSLAHRRLDHATAEFFVSATSEGGVPFVLRVAPAEGFTLGDTTVTAASGRWPGHAGVADGETRRVVLDVTELVRQLQATGARFAVMEPIGAGAGDVSVGLAADRLGSGVLARIRVYTSALR